MNDSLQNNNNNNKLGTHINVNVMYIRDTYVFWKFSRMTISPSDKPRYEDYYDLVLVS